MKDNDKDFRIVSLHNETDIDEPVEQLDLTNIVERFVSTMRMMYMDHTCDEEEELDTETIRTSYQLAKELRYAISDCGEDMGLYLHIYLETLFNDEQSPINGTWFELICDDDMKINALKIMHSVQYSVCQMLMAKMSNDMNEGDSDGEEE